MKVFDNKNELIYDGDVTETEIIAEMSGIEVSKLIVKKDEKELRHERKMNTDYNGTSISLTSADAIALMQIKTAFKLGAKRTIMKFKNGTNMEMTPDIFTKFAPWFVGKRNEFFQ